MEVKLSLYLTDRQSPVGQQLFKGQEEAGLLASIKFGFQSINQPECETVIEGQLIAFL